MGVVSWLVALPSCAWLAKYSRRWGLVDIGGAESHKPSGRIVPNTGGMAIFLATAGPLAILLPAIWLVPINAWARLAPPLAEHLPGLQATTAIGGVLLVAMAAIHLLGVIDDRRPIGPWIKLALQACIALALVWLGDMRVLHVLDQLGTLGHAASLTISAIWIVVIMNAFNFLDNMDGLSAGVAAVATALYLATTLLAGQWFVAALAALLLGALLAVLVFNAPPARLFMGDGGSLLVGLLVAVIAIRTTYTLTPDPITSTLDATTLRWHVLLTPLMILAVPLYDLTSVTILRIRQGRSPLQGDRQHFSHRLVRRGYTKPRAVSVVCLAALATGLSGVMLAELSPWQAVLACGQTAAVLILLAALETG